MRLRLIAMVFVAVGVAMEAARAGAWTLDRGQTQAISTVTLSRATRSFDNSSNPSRTIFFEKTLAQNWIEYGLTDAVTLFVAPEYVMANSDMDGQGTSSARDTAVEAGARVLLLSHIGMLSIQASGKTAGAFDMSVSSDAASGRQIELRLLYGRGFKLYGRTGFFDLQVAERWISRPRPNEMTVDATTGLWLWPGGLAMFQSFNTISGGGGQAPYKFYRVHKLELSVVQRITPRWSLQVGVFASPAGQNIIVEQGVAMAIWMRC